MRRSSKKSDDNEDDDVEVDVGEWDSLYCSHCYWVSEHELVLRRAVRQLLQIYSRRIFITSALSFRRK